MTSALALASGNLDMMINRLPAATAFLKTQPTVNLTITPGENRGLVVNTVHIPNVKIRQALVYAMNPQAIVDSAMMGLGQPVLQTPISPATFGYTTDLPKYSYNPDKARQLLAEAGYKKGEKTYSIAVRSYDAPWVEAIAGQWRDVGFDVTLNVLETGAFNAIRPTENWDFLATIPTRPDATLVFPYFEPQNIPSPNFSRYTGVGAIQAEYQKQLDVTLQLEFLKLWQQQIAADLPYIYSIDGTRVTVTTLKLKGDSPNTHYWLTLFYPMYYEK
jgi:ABC-type transport system substrate-binding protein